ncbi:PAS domain-containing protein [Rhodovibrio salinarum]|uniref:PAS domain-containing protein n=1 Tax=Rhodovibrio salinarum TaxID=1087 RepID=A0A934QKM1_9PROT|nr:PAS domain-containing protein [Rhodovibrio salinarum]MBK1698628.1 PAS domain-containing protein [Rhodovibrio salinarum]
MSSVAFEEMPASRLPDPVLTRLYRYWDALREARAGPTRPEVDPIDMPREVLPDLMLTEVVLADGTRRYRYRIVGSRIAEQAGADPTRQFLDEALPREFGYLDYILGLYDALVDIVRPLYSRSSYVTADTSSSPERETHRLMLPIVAAEGAVTHVLAAQVFHVQRGVTQKPFLSPDGVSYGETVLVTPD